MTRSGTVYAVYGLLFSMATLRSTSQLEQLKSKAPHNHHRQMRGTNTASSSPQSNKRSPALTLCGVPALRGALHGQALSRHLPQHAALGGPVIVTAGVHGGLGRQLNGQTQYTE